MKSTKPWKVGRTMQNQVGIGKQDFAALRESQCFYIDKTDFIRQWWNYRDDVTLLTRPRRFGKILNMSMLNCFFSNKYADRGDLFEGLDIWKDSGYRQIQGTYPVLYLSFASVKANNVSDAKKQVKSRIVSLYQDFEYLLENEKLMESEKMAYRHILTEMAEMEHIIWIKVSAPTAEGKITPVANASILVATAIASNVFVFRVLFSQKAASSFFRESQIILIPR